MGCFLTLRIKPIYSSYAEIEIVKDDNSGIAKMPGFEAFSDDKKLEDKIRNIGLRPIAQATIDKLSEPVNSLFLTPDCRSIRCYDKNKRQKIILMNKQKHNILQKNIILKF